MKRYIVAILLIVSSNAFSDECTIDATTPEINNITNIAIPNCATKRNLSQLEKGNASRLCEKCIADFQKRIPSHQHSSVRSIKQIDKDDYLKKSFNEFEKVLTNTLVDITKIRVIPNTNSKFEKSIQACNVSPAAFEKCSPEVKNLVPALIQGMKSRLANELANIISLNPNKPSGLLNRRDSQLANCSLTDLNLTEQNLNSINASVLEDSLVPDFVNKARNIKFSGHTLKDLLNDIKSEVNEADLMSHPIFATFSNDPASLLQLLQKVSPATIEKLKESLYTKETGDRMDSALAQSCKEATTAIVSDICSEDFKNSNFKSDIKAVTADLNKTYGGPSDEEYATSNTLIQYNLELAQLCKIKQNDKGLDINKLKKEISKNTDPRYSDMSKEHFELAKYQNDFSRTQEKICNALKDGKACDNKDSTQCKILSKYKAVQQKETADSRLANSSNPEINNLLRSMIDGATSSPETRKILVAEGILPKEDGQFVAQPKVPEREPNYFQKVASASSEQKTMYAAAPGKVTKSSTGSNVAPSVDSFYRSPTPSISPSLENSAVSESSSMNTDILQNMRDLSQINSEIARRLMGSKTQSNVSRSDVRSIAESVLKEQRKIQPTTAMIDNTVEDFYSEVERKRDQSPIGGQMNQGTASLARPSQSEAQRRYNNQMNKALEDFGKGSRDVAMANVASDFSVKVQEGKDKESMSKVEVFTSLDKLEKANLADVLKLKAQKDAEGRRLVELVKKKENFILNVNKTSLMIKFTDSKDGFEIIRIGSSGTKIDDKVVSEVRSFIKENYSTVSLNNLKNQIVAP